MFAEMCGTALPIVVTHEFGHSRGLPVVKNSSDGEHDKGPWPSGTKGLMGQGNDSGTTQVPGKWLRYQDWVAMNINSEHPEIEP
jgi:hypothetical protein